MISMADASKPPASPHLTSDVKVVCGYIGGRTPHVWTPAEWDRFGKMARLPIWVNDRSSGTDQGFRCLRAAFAQRIPLKSRIVFDLETDIEKDTVSQFASVLRYFGYRTWVYGSASTVFSNPPCNGYWVADWTHKPHMFVAPMVRATQWTNGQTWDLSVVKTWVYRSRFSTWWRG